MRRARGAGRRAPHPSKPCPSSQVNGGAAVLFSGLDFERLVLAGGPLGLMAAALDVAVPYAATRRQFGARIGDHQLVAAKLADMYAARAAARALVMQAARAADGGAFESRAARARDCAAAILVAAESGTRVALDAIQAGGWGRWGVGWWRGARGAGNERGPPHPALDPASPPPAPLPSPFPLGPGGQWLHQRIPDGCGFGGTGCRLGGGRELREGGATPGATPRAALPQPTHPHASATPSRPTAAGRQAVRNRGGHIG